MNISRMMNNNPSYKCERAKLEVILFSARICRLIVFTFFYESFFCDRENFIRGAVATRKRFMARNRSVKFIYDFFELRYVTN